MNFLGRKAIGPISNVFGRKMKEDLNTFGNKLAKTGVNKAHDHIEEQMKNIILH